MIIPDTLPKKEVISMAWQNKNLTPLGREIKSKLINKNMTQRELAQTLGITPQYITKILSGSRSGERYLPRIGEILGINIWEYAA